MSKAETLYQRISRFIPEGTPRYLRCYDAGPDSSVDRYTVVFTGNWAGKHNRGERKSFPYIAMNDAPNHPQGFGQHGESLNNSCDRPRYKHLGKKKDFFDLPKDCRTMALQDYKVFWGLNPPDVTAKQATKFTMDICMSDRERSHMVRIADAVAHKYGSPAPFQMYLNAWRKYMYLYPFAEIAAHRVLHETRKFL